MLRKRKGFTLLEIMLAISLASLLIIMGVRFQRIGIDAFSLQRKSYKVQTNVKSALDQVSSILKKSSSVWPVDKRKFDNTLADPLPKYDPNKAMWNYIALSSDRKSINNYVWRPNATGNGGHYEVISLTAKDQQGGKEIFYNLEFFKGMEAKKISEFVETGMLNVVLSGEYKDSGESDASDPFSLSSDILLDNVRDKKIPTISVQDMSKITALAYMQIDRKDVAVEEKDEAMVIFVCDTSGSMSEKIGSPFPIERKWGSYYGGYQYINDNDWKPIYDENGNQVKSFDWQHHQYFYDGPERKTALIEEYTKDFFMPIPDPENIYYSWSEGTMCYKDKKGKDCVVFDGGRNVLYRPPSPGVQYYYDGYVKKMVWRKVQTGETVKINLGKSMNEIRWTVFKEKYKEFVQDLQMKGLKDFRVITFSSMSEKVFPKADTVGMEGAVTALDSYDPEGGTNLGIALRSAFRELNSVSNKKKYLLILTDGVPTMWTYKDNVNFLGFGKSNHGRERNPYDGEKLYLYGGRPRPVEVDYAKKDIAIHSQNLNKGIEKIFLIGFSAKPEETAEITNIKDILARQTKNVEDRIATSSEELEMVLKEASNSIAKDMWYYTGP